MQSAGSQTKPAPTSFLSAVSACRGAFIGLALFSALINVLYLTGSFYMLQVYDRVIPSRSVPTLIALSVLAATLYAGQAILEGLSQSLRTSRETGELARSSTWAALVWSL